MRYPLADLLRPLKGALCGLIAATSIVPSDATADSEFKPTRYPFLPELTLDEHPTLCAAFLGAVTRAFLSEAYYIDVFRQPWPDAATPQITWQDWSDLAGRSSSRPIKFIELDFGDDRPATVISLFKYIDWPGSGNHLHALALVDRRDRFDALAADFARPSPPRFDEESIDNLPRTSDGHAVVISERPHPWAVLEHGGRYFVFNAAPLAAETPIASPDPLDAFAVHEIRSDMTVRTVCAARAYPFPAAAEMRAFREARRAAWDRHWPEIELPDALLGPSELLSLYHTLSMMLGSGGTCGSQLPAYRVRYPAEMAKLRIAVRPWATPAVPVPPTGAGVRRIRAYLAYWATQGLWNYRLHRHLDGQIAAARAPLTAYYRDGFGVSEDRAEVAASAALNRILIGHFPIGQPGYPSYFSVFDAIYLGLTGVFGIDSDADSVVNFEEYFSITLEEKIDIALGTEFELGRHLGLQLLGEAALAGLPAARLESLIEANPAIVQLDAEMLRWVDRDSILVYALEHTHLVAFLLDAGIDVNHRNRFGKTALMYAAHFDLADAVAMLLDRGADMGLATEPGRAGCYTEVARGNRTALTYAAEYASLETIRMLLDAGARTDVEDSLGNSLLIYLEHNDRLSDAERAEAATLLSSDR